MQKFNMPVSKKEAINGKNEFVKKGDVTVTVPTLEDILPYVQNARVKEVDSDGLPVYEGEEANYIFGSLLAAVKVQARNRVEIVGDTVKVKDGLKIAETWAELVAEGERTGGEALAILREAKEDFAKWVSTLGKSDTAAKVLISLFNTKAARQTQGNDKKQKFAAYVEQFASSLTEDKLARYERTLSGVMEDLQPATEAEDF